MTICNWIKKCSLIAIGMLSTQGVWSAQNHRTQDAPLINEMPTSSRMLIYNQSCAAKRSLILPMEASMVRFNLGLCNTLSIDTQEEKNLKPRAPYNLEFDKLLVETTVKIIANINSNLEDITNITDEQLFFKTYGVDADFFIQGFFNSSYVQRELKRNANKPPMEIKNKLILGLFRDMWGINMFEGSKEPFAGTSSVRNMAKYAVCMAALKQIFNPSLSKSLLAKIFSKSWIEYNCFAFVDSFIDIYYGKSTQNRLFFIQKGEESSFGNILKSLLDLMTFDRENTENGLLKNKLIYASGFIKYMQCSISLGQWNYMESLQFLFLLYAKNTSTLAHNPQEVLNQNNMTIKLLMDVLFDDKIPNLINSKRVRLMEEWEIVKKTRLMDFCNGQQDYIQELFHLQEYGGEVEKFSLSNIILSLFNRDELKLELYVGNINLISHILQNEREKCNKSIKSQYQQNKIKLIKNIKKLCESFVKAKAGDRDFNTCIKNFYVPMIFMHKLIKYNNNCNIIVYRLKQIITKVACMFNDNNTYHISNVKNILVDNTNILSLPKIIIGTIIDGLLEYTVVKDMGFEMQNFYKEETYALIKKILMEIIYDEKKILELNITEEQMQLRDFLFNSGAENFGMLMLRYLATINAYHFGNYDPKGEACMYYKIITDNLNKLRAYFCL